MFSLYYSLLQNVCRPAGRLMVLVTAFSAIGLSGSSRDGLSAHGQPKTWAQAASLEDDGASAKGKTVAAGTLQRAEGAAQIVADKILEKNDRAVTAAREAAAAGIGVLVMDGGHQAGAAGEPVMDGGGQAGAIGEPAAADGRQAGTIRKQIAEKRRENAAWEQQAAADREQEKGEPEAGGTSNARIAYDEQDYEVMLKIVQAEAGGCDSTGKILVANVIMNRVESAGFPDDITSVVYERSQFSPVSSGAIDRVQVTRDTVECVDRALKGEDHSQGALYFMNRRASGDNAKWFDRKLTFLFSHDGHEFFK